MQGFAGAQRNDVLVAELQLTTVFCKPFSLREIVGVIRRSVEAYVP